MHEDWEQMNQESYQVNSDISDDSSDVEITKDQALIVAN